MDDATIDRRTLLRGGAVAGGALAITSAAGMLSGVARKAFAQAPGARASSLPNILVIIVDQLRAPQGFQTTAAARGMMPNLAALRKGAVSFASHYTAADDCTPARSTLLTGLYSHQTGCLMTGGSTLAPVFPTWGTMLRDYGYVTAYFGKWHLTHGDDNWTMARNSNALEKYGFDGGSYPSPDGAPGQGTLVDPLITAQFTNWYATAPASRPWCTTVSLVNPHDIAWWYRWTIPFAQERRPPSIVSTLPANFETPLQLFARRKPTLQLALQDTAAAAFGSVPFTGPAAVKAWLPFMNLYLALSALVDRQIGAVIATLASRPTLAANTVVVFTSDHGEYGASHGLRGKGAGVYEEAIRVPLIVNDLRGKLTRAPTVDRTGLTSSVDVAPLLLTIASGSNAWRKDRRFAHIAGRHDLAAMLANPRAPGRGFVLHATDEVLSEFASKPYLFGAPLHVTAIRTRTAKYALYSHWAPQSNNVASVGQQRELYDYSTRNGRLELRNVAGSSRLEHTLNAQITAAIRNELRAPIPARWRTAQATAYFSYYQIAQLDALAALGTTRSGRSGST
jgi:arylsulfatase A-like enzyme